MPYTPRLPDYAHQTAAKNKMRGQRAFALFLEMGTGKSKTLLDDLGETAARGSVDRALVIAGKGSYADWLSEHVPTNWDEETVPYTIHLWEGGDKAEQRQLKLFLEGPPIFRFLLMNIEALSASAKAQKLAVAFVNGGKSAIVVDEASKIKRRNSIRAKVLTDLSRGAVMRRILTGSPVTQSPLDLWSQCDFLKAGLLGYSHFMAFRARYCNLKTITLKGTSMGNAAAKRKGRRITKVESFRNLAELEERIKPFSYRVMKEDCLDLPPKIYRRYVVDLTDEQFRIYQDMKRWAVAELEQGVFASATMAVARLGKLHQIACGHVRNEHGEVTSIPSNRISALLEVVEEAGGKVLVWCAYRYDVAVVASALRKEYGDASVVEYHGGTVQDDRLTAIKRIQEGDARFFVATQATGGYGLTLTAAQTSVYYSNTFNLEHRLQSEDRNHRIGQKGSVTYVDLVARDTVDEKVIAALREKKDIAHLVMGDGIREWIR